MSFSTTTNKFILPKFAAVENLCRVWPDETPDVPMICTVKFQILF